jgi:hypothetical protein
MSVALPIQSPIYKNLGTSLVNICTKTVVQFMSNPARLNVADFFVVGFKDFFQRNFVPINVG